MAKNRNHIRKYFSLRIRGSDGLESLKNKGQNCNVKHGQLIALNWRLDSILSSKPSALTDPYTRGGHADKDHICLQHSRTHISLEDTPTRTMYAFSTHRPIYLIEGHADKDHKAVGCTWSCYTVLSPWS